MGIAGKGQQSAPRGKSGGHYLRGGFRIVAVDFEGGGEDQQEDCFAAAWAEEIINVNFQDFR